MQNKFERYKQNLEKRIKLSKEILEVTNSIIFDLKNTETVNTIEVAIQELKIEIENMQNLLNELITFINYVESNEQ
jgi:predicted translin family RNA/ssDNA-binding protein